MQTVADGKSKKESKKNSAIKMLDELKKLPPAEPENDLQKNNINENNKQNLNREKKKHKKRVRNIIKVIKENPDYGKGTLNPICRLSQIQQAKKLPEPVYELLEEKRKFRRYEFKMLVTVGDLKCQGVGGNKREAKQNAAETMLVQLGYPPSQQISQQQLQHQQQILILQNQQPPKPVLKNQTTKLLRNSNNLTNENNNVSEKKVKFVDIKEEEEESDKNEGN